MIYADYNGSAPLDTREKLPFKRLEDGPFANPNAIHNLGTKTLMGMEKARSICAKILGAKKHQIFFNSGSTEGIATVFHSILSEAKKITEPHLLFLALSMPLFQIQPTIMKKRALKKNSSHNQVWHSRYESPQKMA